MAAPIVAVLPAVFAALWSGLKAVLLWFLARLHIVKIIAVCTVMLAAFYVGKQLYSSLVTQAAQYLGNISNSSPGSAGSVSFSLLAKANYVLPITEMFALLVVYVSFAGFCLALKGLIAGYKSIPFKAA